MVRYTRGAPRASSSICSRASATTQLSDEEFAWWFDRNPGR